MTESENETSDLRKMLQDAQAKIAELEQELAREKVKNTRRRDPVLLRDIPDPATVGGI